MIAQTPNKESGSAILWILVAIALFAALNFAFNSNSRTSTSFLDDAEAESYAKQIIQYGNEVKAAVKRLQLRGCSDTEISFENNVIKTEDNSIFYAAHDTTVSDKCKVHHINGGGIEPKFIETIGDGSVTGPTFPKPGSSLAIDTTHTGQGTSAIDLSIAFRRIREDICLKINDLLSIENPNGNAPIDTLEGGVLNYFFGTYDGDGEIGNGQSAADIRLAKGGCVSDGIDTYDYYHVLIAR